MPQNSERDTDWIIDVNNDNNDWIIDGDFASLEIVNFEKLDENKFKMWWKITNPCHPPSDLLWYTKKRLKKYFKKQKIKSSNLQQQWG